MRRFVTTATDQPIVCGPVRKQRADPIVGDADGVAVLPHEHAAIIVENADAIEQVETAMKAFPDSGNTLVAAVERYRQR
jgi:regulator of RNase E activity RraA